MDRKYVALLILLILAIFTRFFGIEFQSLWCDEGSTYYYSHYTWEQFKAIHEPNSPVFYMMEGWALDILGHSEFASRFISAVAGVVTVMASYFVTEKMFKNWRFAILVALLFLISVFCLEYSQEARGYELVLMIFMLQLYVFLHAMETRKFLFWAIFIILAEISFAMQFIAIFSTVTLILYALCVFYQEKKETGNYKPLLNLGIVCVIALVLSLPLMAFAIDAISSHTSVGHWDWCQIGIIYTGDVFYHFFSRVYIIAIAMFILMIFGILYCRKAHREQYKLLIWIMLFPLILTTIASFFTNMTPRYIIWSIPPYLIFVAMSFYYWVTDEKSLKRASTVAIISVVVVAAVTLPLYYTETTKSDFRGSAATLNEYATEGDVLVYAPPWENAVYATLSFYYVPQDHGVTVLPYESEQQLIDLSSDPNYGDVFVLIENNHDPLRYLQEHQSDTCKEIFNGYTNHVFMITAPL